MGIARLLPSALMTLAPFMNAYQVPAPTQPQSVSASTPATTFDVVSIRPSNPKNLSMQIRPGKDSFTITGGSLKFIIQNAYDLQDFQIEGAPEWINSARFDIIAKMDAPSPPTSTPAEEDAEQKLTQSRLQSLLEDRFQLRVHNGTKEMPAYALVVAKDGPKLSPSTKNTGYSSRQGQLVCSGMSMDSLASVLSGMENRIVLDQTKLPGDYAFILKWTRTIPRTRTPIFPDSLPRYRNNSA